MYLAHSGVALAATAADRRVPLIWLLLAAWAFDITGVGHWLPAAAVLVVVAYEVGRRRWDGRAGALLALVVLSHDVLDLIVGVQLLPGGRYIGWDLGPDSALELLLELGVLAVGFAAYLATLPSGARRRPPVWSAFGALVGASVLRALIAPASEDDVVPSVLLVMAGIAVGTAVLLVRADRAGRRVGVD